jgi:superkiller protein 3
MNLGSVYLEKGKLDEAIAEFKQVIAIKPRHTGAYTNLGVVYSRKNRLDEAIAVYKQALAINPDSEEAHINIGTAYGKKGMLDEAIAEFEQTLEINPECAKAYYNIGAAYWEKGMLDNAITEYTKALDINPYYAKAYYKLGLAFEAQHRLQEAIGAYHEAIRLKLDNHEVYNNLAWIYATAPDNTMRDGKEAVKLAIKACELTDFKNAVPLDTIAAAYAEMNNFEKAIEYQERAIKLAPPQIEKELKGRLQLYKSGKPYRAQHD